MRSGILSISDVAIEDESELVLFVEHGAFDRPLLRIGFANAVKKCQLSLLKVLPSVWLRHAILLHGRSIG